MEQDIVVCEICGSGSNSHLIAKCARCNAYEHRYCLQVLTYMIPREWYCADCQEYANGDPKPSQGAQMENLCLNQNNMVHQTSPKSSKKSGNAKVKFISSEEVALLSRQRPPYVRSRFAALGSSEAHPLPANTKHLSNLKCTSTSRSDTQVQALERCAAVTHDQIKIGDRSYSATQPKQVYPTYAARRSAAASHDQTNIDDINMRREARYGGSIPIIQQCTTREPVKRKLYSLTEDSARKKKIANADNEESNSQVEDEPKGTLCASDGDTGCKSVMGSLHPNKDVILTIHSSVWYSRLPAPGICWTGCFHVKDAGKKLNRGEFKAQFPSKVSSKVYDIVKLMPSNLQLELLPRMNDWPESFEIICPGHEDIGLFFFSNEPDGCEKKHSYLLEASSNYVLRTHIDGIKLLIYSSEVLPSDSQWIDGENYLWGIFVRQKRTSDPL